MLFAGRCLLWAACILAAAEHPSRGTAISPGLSPDPIAVRIWPEVRIRKLHLVRPDLIPYPIAFEIVC